jgi:hypothetical protein
MKKITGAARIQVMVEISNNGSYGGEWKLEDMAKQVTEEASNKLQRILRENGGRIIGEPKVVFVIGTEGD